MNAMPFKRSFCVLPPDAKPIGRDQHVTVLPDCSGAWAVYQQDDGGGSVLGSGLSKVEALLIACGYALTWRATLSLRNEA